MKFICVISKITEEYREEIESNDIQSAISKLKESYFQGNVKLKELPVPVIVAHARKE